jgi:hypothetical protein
MRSSSPAAVAEFCHRAPQSRIAQRDGIIYTRYMKGLRYVYWQDHEFWLGYLEEFPDYMTQGTSVEDLQEHLRDLYRDLIRFTHI